MGSGFGLDDFQVLNCTVERWGKDSGSAIDMVGCHRGLILNGTFRAGGTGSRVDGCRIDAIVHADDGRGRAGIGIQG